jgi:hypothetical protein
MDEIKQNDRVIVKKTSRWFPGRVGYFQELFLDFAILSTDDLKEGLSSYTFFSVDKDQIEKY